MLQNSVDNLRLLCYDADVPKRTCCTGGNKTRRGLPPLPERRDALEKITAERVLAELAEIAFADLGAEPAPPVKVGDKLRALELIYKYLGHGAGEIENKDGKIKKRKKWRASLFTTSDVSLMPTL